MTKKPAYRTADPVRKTCKIPWCDGKHFSRGYCAKHWQRWNRLGDPLLTISPDGDVITETDPRKDSADAK